ncbi:MAG: cytochrome c oxidase subunit II [Gaiellaceae bacterium]
MRRISVLVVVGLTALVAVGVAAAANGGFTPVSPNSPNASHTVTAYYVILGFTGAIFVLVEGLLVVFVVKYRRGRRPRTADGAQVHGHTRLELIWTVIPVLILCVIGIVVFLELPKISDAPAASDPIQITVEGHQYYWQFDYPNGARTINDLYVPQNTVVDLKVVSNDVIHSWWVPALGGKIQAIPGRPNHTWFKAEREGTFAGQCAELCGLYHAAMQARVIVTSRTAYEQYVASTANADLGHAEYVGSCAVCHGLSGEGGYGPNLQNSPLLVQSAALDQRVRQGGVKMPAVGDTWTAAQMKALAQYVKAHIYKGAAGGG